MMNIAPPGIPGACLSEHYCTPQAMLGVGPPSPGMGPKMSGGVAQLLSVVIENLLPKPFGLSQPDNLGHLEEVKVVTRFL